jgi:phosphatidylglycerophosphatase A
MHPAANRARAWRVLATWFGAGLAPRAPGTVGSLASLVLWAPLVMIAAPWWVFVGASIALFALGTKAAQVVVDSDGRQDPQIVVIDEVVGMGLTLALCPPRIWAVVLGFLCFRVFDVVKPWPVSLADRNVKGGFGVMLDDVLAAGYALALTVFLTHWLAPKFDWMERLP